MKRVTLFLLPLLMFLWFAAAPSASAQAFSFVNSASSGPEDQSYSDSSRTTGSFPLTPGNLVVCFVRALQNGGNPLTYTTSDKAGNTWSAPVVAGNQNNLAQWAMTYSITTSGSASERVTLKYGANGMTAPYGALLCGQFSVSPGYTWAFDPSSGPAAAYYTTNGTVMTTPLFSTAQPIELIINCDTSYDGGLEYFAGTIGGVKVAGAYFDVNNGLGGGNNEICQYVATSNTQSNITGVATISNGYNPWGTQVMSFYAKPTGATPPPTLLSISVNLPSGTVGQSYSGAATASGGTTPYTYTSSSLPPGLSISSSSGAVSGNPANGTFSTTITVNDSSSPVQTASQTVSVVIAPAVVQITTYTVGGTVSGLSGTGLVLEDNGGNNLSATANGSFTFSTAIAGGGAYGVTVLSQPTSPAQTCSVTNGSGTVSANITNVAITCSTVTHTVGGTISGLSGTGLVLQDNGGNNLSAAANGSFTFSTAIAGGGAYGVTVLSQPTSPAQTCSVTSGSGTVASANVTNVAITCSAVSAHAVTLYWTPVAGAASYVVLRGSSAGNMAQVGATGGTSYVDNTVASGQSYYYEVESVASGGATSPASQVLYITVN